MTVITVGSKYEVYVRSPASSHMLTFRTLAIKWEVNILLKSSCDFPLASFLHASFCVRLSLLLLSRYDTANEYITILQNQKDIFSLPIVILKTNVFDPGQEPVLVTSRIFDTQHLMSGWVHSHPHFSHTHKYKPTGKANLVLMLFSSSFNKQKYYI